MTEGRKDNGHRANRGQQQRTVAADRRCPNCDRKAALGRWSRQCGFPIEFRECRYCGHVVTHQLE